MKITQYGHGICSANGEPCDCATGDHSWAILEERTSGESRTRRGFCLRARRRACGCGRSRDGWLRLCRRCARDWSRARHVIMESNSVLRFVHPDLYLTVLDPATKDFKNSAREFLDRAHAVILHDGADGAAAWRDISLKPVSRRPVFRIAPPNYVREEMVEFVRNVIAAKADSSLRSE